MKNTQQICLLIDELSNILLKNRYFLTVAESCTGGLLGAYLTATSGCSRWFDRGFITYSNLAKQEMLGVSPHVLESFGAVSAEVVCAMAAGALLHSYANLSIAISGIAGPSGGTLEKPVGTVWMAFADKNQIVSQDFLFIGDRAQIQEAAVLHAISGMLDFVKNDNSLSLQSPS